MSQGFYSPNSKLTGGALFVSFNSKEGHAYFKLLRQIANNPNKKGNYDGNNPVNVKLSTDEAAGIIDAVRNNGEYSFYHDFNGNVTSGRFAFYSIQPKTPKDKPKTGYGLTVNKGDVEIKIGFNRGSAERLAQYLEFALDHIFSADYQADKKKFEELKKAKEDQPAARTAQTVVEQETGSDWENTDETTPPAESEDTESADDPGWDSSTL